MLLLKQKSCRLLCIMRITSGRLRLLVLWTHLHFTCLLLGPNSHPDEQSVHCAALFHGDASNRSN